MYVLSYINVTFVARIVVVVLLFFSKVILVERNVKQFVTPYQAHLSDTALVPALFKPAAFRRAFSDVQS